MDLIAQNDSVTDPDRQAGADQILVTEEMIDAGVNILHDASIDLASGHAHAADIAVSVYRAMFRARPSP
jgi:hypothetical protein